MNSMSQLVNSARIMIILLITSKNIMSECYNGIINLTFLGRIMSAIEYKFFDKPIKYKLGEHMIVP